MKYKLSRFLKRMALLLSLLILCCLSVFSQTHTQVVGDSIRLRANNGTTELILENSTQQVNGFLFNKGAGRTEFRSGLVKVNDTLYIIGSDTLKLSAKVSGNNVFYVSKKYAGAGGAIVSGKTLASISSSNAAYNLQLQRAVPGSMMLPFPDPISARNAALEAIGAGQITKATIIILAGNSFTIGSDNSAQNGDLNYNANSGVVADIGFSSTNSKEVASLCQDKINYYFEKDAQLHYINSAYSIPMTYVIDSTDANWSSGIYGQGYFKQYYGQQQGFDSQWCHLDNANGQFAFEADFLELQYYQGFYLISVGKFHIDIKKILAGYVHVLYCAVSREGNGTEIQGYFKCDNLVYGQGKTMNQKNDYWRAINVGDNNWGTVVDGYYVTSLRRKNIDIIIGNADIQVGCPEYDNFIQMRGTLYNANVNILIDNLLQTSAPSGWSSPFGSLVGITFANLNNVLVNVDIKNAVTEYPLFGDVRNSYANPQNFSRFNFHCGLHRKLPSFVVTDDWAKRNINIQNDYLTNVLKAKMVISGTYINESNSEVVAMDYTQMSKLTELKGYFKTNAPSKHVMILNGSQDHRFALTDATLINDGTVPSVSLKGSQNGYATLGGIGVRSTRTIYLKNVHANAPLDTNVSSVGDSLKVVPDLPLYY